MFIYIDFKNFENFGWIMFIYIDFPRFAMQYLRVPGGNFLKNWHVNPSKTISKSLIPICIWCLDPQKFPPAAGSTLAWIKRMKTSCITEYVLIMFIYIDFEIFENLGSIMFIYIYIYEHNSLYARPVIKQVIVMNDME